MPVYKENLHEPVTQFNSESLTSPGDCDENLVALLSLLSLETPNQGPVSPPL